MGFLLCLWTSLTECCLSPWCGVLSTEYVFMKSFGCATTKKLVKDASGKGCWKFSLQNMQPNKCILKWWMNCCKTWESLRHYATWAAREILADIHNHRPLEDDYFCYNLWHLLVLGSSVLDVWSSRNVSDLATRFFIAGHMAKHLADMTPIHGLSNYIKNKACWTPVRHWRCSTGLFETKWDTW